MKKRVVALLLAVNLLLSGGILIGCSSATGGTASSETEVGASVTTDTSPEDTVSESAGIEETTAQDEETEGAVTEKAEDEPKPESSSPSISDDTAATHIYAAPDTCGNGDGSSAEHAIGGLVAAVEAARRAQKPVAVHLAEGEYTLTETLVLDERDSYTAFIGEGAVITSGRRLTDWRDEGSDIVSAAVPADERFTQLFIDGERRERTRYPEEGILLTKGSTVSGSGWANDVEVDEKDELATRLMYFDPQDMPSGLYRMEDVEFVVLQYWMESRLYLEDMNFANGEALFKTGSWRPLTWSYGFYMENVREGLNVPGRWYHDMSENRIYYHLQEGETAETLRAAYPELTDLLRVSPASRQDGVTDLRFEGITFSGSDGHDSGVGYYSVQAELNAPDAILLEYTDNSGFFNCRFEGLGGWGLRMLEGCNRNYVERCTFTDCGAGAIRLGSTDDPMYEVMKTDHITVRNNLVKDCGEFYLGSAGIWVGNCSYVDIEHNDISGPLQWAISLGWIWQVLPLHYTIGNRIAWNHVHDVGTGVLGNHGAIYLLGGCPNTVVEYNLVENVSGSEYWGAGEGFILDNGCSGITIQYNVVRNANAGGWGCNFNCFGNTIRNNIFAFGKLYQLTRYGDPPDADPAPPNGELFTQNIIIWTDGSLFKESEWYSYSTYWDYNLYWCTTGKVRFMRLALEGWQKKNLDIHSVVADPKFADAVNGDFTLADDSPAYSIGFEAFSLDGVGIEPENGN